jgi:hypothetical protein
MRGAGGLSATLVGVCLVFAGCATSKESMGGDAHLDEVSGPDRQARASAKDCGPEGKGDLVLLDARTGAVVPCLTVSISREAMSCPLEAECPSDVVFRGTSNKQGQVVLSGALEKARLVAAASGFGPSVLSNATTKAGRVLELELAPEEGFWLKVLDAEGNYLQDLSLTFKQGDEVLAQARSNTLANIFFAQRQLFAGEPVTVEAPGFRPATIAGVAELGEDGHTLVLAR